MRQHKNKIIAGLITILVLVFLYCWGGDAPGLQEEQPKSTQIPEVISSTEAPAPTVSPTQASAPSKEPYVSTAPPSFTPKNTALEEIPEISEAPKPTFEPKPTLEPVPTPSNTPENLTEKYTCTLSIRCDTILDNLEWLNPEKIELIPADGIILSERTVPFSEGESVFDLLLRETKNNNIHLEFVNTPIYNSVYIEGIANLYEFDCGELSGWRYSVNGEFPNRGCSQYKLKNGDYIEWIYTSNFMKPETQNNE